MSAKTTNSPAMLTVLDQVFSLLANNNDRAAAIDLDTDTKLAWLYGRAAGIPNSMGPDKRELAVRATACAAIAWLDALHLSQMDIVERIADERLRQRELFTARKISFTCTSPVVGWPRKFRVLAEEIGEVAEAIDLLEASPRSKTAKKHFVTELIQVAAVLVAWLESFEVKI
jgi:hypothetical protein